MRHCRPCGKLGSLVHIPIATGINGSGADTFTSADGDVPNGMGFSGGAGADFSLDCFGLGSASSSKSDSWPNFSGCCGFSFEDMLTLKSVSYLRFISLLLSETGRRLVLWSRNLRLRKAEKY
jgi:hypothetical protein